MYIHRYNIYILCNGTFDGISWESIEIYPLVK